MNVMDSLSTAKSFPLWLENRNDKTDNRPRLNGDQSVDVAIVGGGFSGLWTAYYLLKHSPSTRVLVIEKNFCGYGASGRNGGWCKGSVAGGANRYAALSSFDKVNKLQSAMFDAVDEIGCVAANERIACGFEKNGLVRVARNRAQALRQISEVRDANASGFTPEIIRLLDKDEASRMLNATSIHSGIFFSPAAALNPFQLVKGLASSIERTGGKIVEQTEVLDIQDRRIMTPYGVVTANVVVQATEAYTRNFSGRKRDYLPNYSRMIATEPLSQKFLGELGLTERKAFSDDRYGVIYGLLTEDNRIAFGARGTPTYLFGSKITSEAENNIKSHALVYKALLDLLPQLKDVEVTHRWGGVLAIPRNWLPGLRFNKSSGLGVLGGYVGSGVASSNLAGRTMADLILGRETDRTYLPWVGVRSRRWEPEPFRSMGVMASGSLLKMADSFETKTGRTSRVAKILAKAIRGS